MLECDGRTATPSNISSLLLGSDIPGTTITLKIQRGETWMKEVLDIDLQRACSHEIADRKKLDELLNAIKQGCLQYRDASGCGAVTEHVLEHVDQVRALWMKMIEAEQTHLEGIISDDVACKRQAADLLADLHLHVQAVARAAQAGRHSVALAHSAQKRLEERVATHSLDPDALHPLEEQVLAVERAVAPCCDIAALLRSTLASLEVCLCVIE